MDRSGRYARTHACTHAWVALENKQFRSTEPRLNDPISGNYSKKWHGEHNFGRGLKTFFERISIIHFPFVYPPSTHISIFLSSSCIRPSYYSSPSTSSSSHPSCFNDSLSFHTVMNTPFKARGSFCQTRT